MTDTRPWHALRLDDPYLPELPEQGSVTVALVAAPGARVDRWAARAAAAMARAWASTGQPTYLCDLALEEPELHDVLGIENGEGVTDLLLYGASPRRIAHPVDEGLFLAPAGTVAADPEAVRASPRWDALVDAFAGAGALLLLYVPADVPGLAAVLARADAVVTFGRADEPLELGEASERVLARMGPGGSAVPVGAGAVSKAVSAAATGSARTVAAAAAGAGDGGRAAGPIPAEPAAPVSEVPPGADPTARRSRADGPRPRWGRWVVVFLLVAVLLLALAVALRWIELPGLSDNGPGARTDDPAEAAGEAATVPASTPDTAPPTSPPAAPDPTSPPGLLAATAFQGDEPMQAWSLTLEAHETFDLARARVDELDGRWPDLLFWIAPIAVDGQRFHRVLAGPATSPGEAEALRGRLGGDPRWILRGATLGFLLGEMPDLDAARQWSRALAELEVPTHVLRGGPADAPTFRVYAGSYGSEAEAESLRELLEERGFGSPPLTERRGVPPA